MDVERGGFAVISKTIETERGRGAGQVVSVCALIGDWNGKLVVKYLQKYSKQQTDLSIL